MGKRIGRQEPTVWSTLPYKKSVGKLASELYEQTGNKVLKWQKKQIEAILAVDRKGNYVHRRYGLSVPRRNGKTEIFLMREFYALEHGERVLHTAHLTSTSSDASRRLAEALVFSSLGMTMVYYTTQALSISFIISPFDIDNIPGTFSITKNCGSVSCTIEK